MDARDREAAQDGVRLMIAEAQRLQAMLDSGQSGAEYHAAVVKRAAVVSCHAGALVSTLARSLPESVRGCERAAWGDGLQGGLDAIRPGDAEVRT